MKTIRVLNLGAGVQSTALYLMSARGEEPETIPPFDFAVFADTQEEPEAVYRHLDWLRSQGGSPILTATAGKLGDNLVNGLNSRGGRFASIPAFTSASEGGDAGLTRRQCTKEYKIEVITRVIREQVLGVAKGERVPVKEVRVEQYFGLSFDEPRRVAKVRARFESHPWSGAFFPLFDLFITRGECRQWLGRRRIPHVVPRSACSFCPFHSDVEWREIRDHDPASWRRAVEVDEALRRPGSVVNRGFDQSLYLHRSCVPLARADIDAPARPVAMRLNFSGLGLGVEDQECEGMCGV